MGKLPVTLSWRSTPLPAPVFLLKTNTVSDPKKTLSQAKWFSGEVQEMLQVRKGRIKELIKQDAAVGNQLRPTRNF